MDHNKLTELPNSIGTLFYSLLIPPDCISGDLNSLEILDVGRNCLTLLPSTLGKLPHLQVFRATRNSLQEVPTMLTYMPYLKVLALEDNLLTELPSSLGKLKALRELLIGGNQLASFSPAAIAKLENLQVLDISNNPGAVRLPAEFIDSHVATIYYGCGADRSVKTLSGSQLKVREQQKKEKKKEKKEKKDKKKEKKKKITAATMSNNPERTLTPPPSEFAAERRASVTMDTSQRSSSKGSKIEDSNSNSRQGSQIEGKEKKGSRIEESKGSSDAMMKEEKEKPQKSEKALARLSGFFGMSKMHLTQEKDKQSKVPPVVEEKKRLSRHVQIAVREFFLEGILNLLFLINSSLSLGAPWKVELRCTCRDYVIIYNVVFVVVVSSSDGCSHESNKEPSFACSKHDQGGDRAL